MGPREQSRAFAIEVFPLLGSRSLIEEAPMLFKARRLGLDTTVVRDVWKSLREMRASEFAA